MQFFKAELITRKENNKIIAKVTERLTAIKKELNTIQLKPHVKYGLLYQNETGAWRIADNHETARIPSGLYTYVCTKSGFIRLEPLLYGETKHLVLSEYAEKVRYAGWISFKKDGGGEMEFWNNDSGGYKPSPHQCHQAGLPLDLFQNNSPNLHGDKMMGDDVFCLEKHKQAIQQKAAQTIFNAYKNYQARKQNKAYRALRTKARLAAISNDNEPALDETPKQAIIVPCS